MIGFMALRTMSAFIAKLSLGDGERPSQEADEGKDKGMNMK